MREEKCKKAGSLLNRPFRLGRDGVILTLDPLHPIRVKLLPELTTENHRKIATYCNLSIIPSFFFHCRLVDYARIHAQTVTKRSPKIVLTWTAEWQLLSGSKLRIKTSRLEAVHKQYQSRAQPTLSAYRAVVTYSTEVRTSSSSAARYGNRQ